MNAAAHTGNRPPQDLDAERNLLGAAMLSATALEDGLELLKPGDFYAQAHQQLWAVMAAMHATSTPVDLVTVAAKLNEAKRLEQVGGAAYLAELTDIVPMRHGRAWAELIRRKSQQRQLITLGQEVVRLGLESTLEMQDILAEVEAGLFRISSSSGQELASMAELMPEVLEQVAKRRELAGGVTGVPTGFERLNQMTAGLQPGDLIILAGRPSMGKTALAFNLLVNGAKQGTAGLGFSLEMGKLQLGERFLAAGSTINSHLIRTGGVNDAEFATLAGAVGQLSELPIHLDDTAGLSVVELRIRARRAKAKHDIGLIVVDYLQLLQSREFSNQRQEEVASFTRGLKAMARELEVPVIALSQLSRKVEERADKTPKLADLRESGAIEQDADVVMFLYRDDYYNKRSLKAGLATLIVAKQRMGATGELDLVFLPQYSRFENYSSLYDGQEPGAGGQPWEG